MYYDELDTFFNACSDVMVFIRDMFIELFYTFFGHRTEITVNHLWFWLAALPSLLLFAIEIFFSFVLSFRVHKLSIFVPWRRSSYYVLRSGRLHSVANVGLPVVRRGKIDKNKNVVLSPRLLSFQRVSPVSDVKGHVLNKPLVANSEKSLLPHTTQKPLGGRSNEVRRFIPRVTLLVQKFHGFKQVQVRFFGIFRTVYSQKFKKKS